MIRLEQLRFNAGLTTRQLADAAGVDRKTIERIEQEKTTRTSPKVAKALADYFSTPEEPLSALDVLAKVETAATT